MNPDNDDESESRVKSHPALRAYMAGITVPTLFQLLLLGLLIGLRPVHPLPVKPLGFLVFPMAVVPNAWGAWNALRVVSSLPKRVGLGWYGACLAVLLPLAGYAIARLLGFEHPAFPGRAIALGWPIVIAVYYLVWKHLVGYLNRLLGIDV